MFTCNHCDVEFKTDKGLKIHIGKAHKSTSLDTPEKTRSFSVSEEPKLILTPSKESVREEEVDVDENIVTCNDLKEHRSDQTEDSSLLILQGEVAEDSDDEDIPVGETFWPLKEVFYFDRHIKSVRKAPTGCWVNTYGLIKDIKTGKVKGNISK